LYKAFVGLSSYAFQAKRAMRFLLLDLAQTLVHDVAHFGLAQAPLVCVIVNFVIVTLQRFE
jgi:hypothetical protein